MNGAIKLENNAELGTVLNVNPKEEFGKRRWVLITNIPDGVNVEVRKLVKVTVKWNYIPPAVDGNKIIEHSLEMTFKA